MTKWTEPKTWQAPEASVALDWRAAVVLIPAVGVVAWLLGAGSLTWPELLSLLGILIFGAWTTPKTWTAVVVTVADLNTHIRDNLNVLKTSIDDNGHLILPVIQSKSANYGIAGTDDVVICTANSFTVTLPTAVGRTGKLFIVKDMGTGTITMASTSSQTIDGASAGSTTLVQYDSLTFYSDGANYIII